jgi:transposase-like protein
MATKSMIKSEERVELVLRLLRREEPAAQIARRAEISEQTLYRWRDEFIAAGKSGLGEEAMERTNRRGRLSGWSGR